MKRRDAVFLSGLMLLFVTGAAIHATQGVMLSSYIEEYALHGGAQGYTTSIQEVGLILSIFFSAYLLRRFVKARILLFMAAMMTFSLVGLGLKPSYWLLCTFYLCFGLSFGSLDSLSSSLISDLYPERSGVVMNYQRAFYSVGGMLAPLVLNRLLQAGFRWNRAIFVVAGFGLLIFFYFALCSYPRIPKPVQKTEVRDDVSLKALASFMKKPGALLIVLIGFCFASHQIGLTVWIVRYLTVYKDIGNAGLHILSWYWVGMLASRLILPRLVTSPRVVLIGGTLVAGILLTVELSVTNSALACILMACVGFFEGPIVPMVVNCACQIDRSNSALACSTLIFVNNIGGMIAPTLIGVLIARVSPVVGIAFLPVTLFLCCGFSILLFTNERRKYGKKGNS